MALRELQISGGNPTEHLERPCVRFDNDAPVVVPLGDVDVAAGSIQVDLALTGERSFPGLAWRIERDTYESFFVRPHQSGNPDAVQYTPVFKGLSSWQLYHGSGFWNPIPIPIGRWFTVRVSFSGSRAEAFVDEKDSPALAIGPLRVPAASGRIGLLPGGPGVYFARFLLDTTQPTFVGAPPPVEDRHDGTVPGWWISNIVAEGVAPAAARTWTYLEAEPSGLANLARVNPLGTTLNTVFARTTIVAQSAGVRAMDLGFSDRAVVYLNGRPLFAGRDDYRSRDYRFLGSLGYWDTVFLPLEQTDNELIVAVSETFGGWGLKARFADSSGLTFKK